MDALKKFGIPWLRHTWVFLTHCLYSAFYNDIPRAVTNDDDADDGDECSLACNVTRTLCRPTLHLVMQGAN